MTGNEFGNLLTGTNATDLIQDLGGNDTLVANGNSDTLEGGEGEDLFQFAADNVDVTLNGGLGEDTLSGGSGNDTLVGGTGQESLTGDAGKDVFVFSNLSHSAVGGNRDVIRDFEKGQDKIDIDGFSNDTFVFIGGAGFSGTGDAEIRVTTNAFGNSIMRIDANGDGITDSEILVRGIANLDAGDFVL